MKFWLQIWLHKFKFKFKWNFNRNSNLPPILCDTYVINRGLVCAFFNFDHLRDYTLKFRPHSPSSLSLYSSSLTFKLLSMASSGGELVLDSSSPWSGNSNHLSSFSILLPFIFKKKRTSLMKKIQGLLALHGATLCGIKASPSRWCCFASSIFCLFNSL